MWLPQPNPETSTPNQLEYARIAAEKKLISTAKNAATSFDPIISALFATEMDWRGQTRINGKSTEGAQLLARAVIELATKLGWVAQS